MVQATTHATAYFAETVSALGLAGVTNDVLMHRVGVRRRRRWRSAASDSRPTWARTRLPLDASAPLLAASTVEEIEAGAIEGAILLLHGAIASGQLMPKKFTFYNPAEHKRIIAALEAARPAAVVAATGTDPYLVGGQYPFPLFEDGDFDIPNAYVRDVDGERLLEHVGLDRLRQHRVATGARDRGARDRERSRAGKPGRFVVSAHIDSRKGSPGALDNATGVATLLGLAELLGEGRGVGRARTIELVPFNGEDNYANPGEMMWVAENEGRFGDIILGINVDDSGQLGAENNVSFYGCPPGIEAAVRKRHAGPRTAQRGAAVGARRPRDPRHLQGAGDRGRIERDVPLHGEVRAHRARHARAGGPGLVADASRFIHDVLREVSRTVAG